jgi:ribose transport system substrate-binding protein
MRIIPERHRALAAFAALALAVTACGGDDGGTDTDGGAAGSDATQDAGDVTIGLAISTLQNPFFVSLRDGAQAAADDAGASLSISDAQDDAQQQADDIQDFITQGVDVLVINPVDSAAIVPSIEAANDAGIPVITVDRGAEGGEVLSHIASDNVLGGQLAGEYLFEEIGGEGTVAQLEGVPGASATNDRGEGFQNALEEADGVELASSQTANFNREEGYSVGQNLFQANPDLVGLFAQNDEMALGALEAAEEAGLEVVVVGFDATDDAVAAVRDGRLAATVAQQPEEMGRMGIEAAVAAAAGEDVDAEQPVEVTVVTSENVDDVFPE